MLKLKEMLKSTLQLQINSLHLSQIDKIPHVPEPQSWEVFQHFFPGKSEDRETRMAWEKEKHPVNPVIALCSSL